MRNGKLTAADDDVVSASEFGADKAAGADDEGGEKLLMSVSNGGMPVNDV